MVLLPQEVSKEVHQMPSALHLPSDKKLVYRSSLMSATAGTKDNLLVMRDSTSAFNFLIDTGAEVRILPASSRDIKNLQQTHLLSRADGKSIPSFGTRLLSFVLVSTEYSWSFIIATVKRPNLGADFLYKNGILVDVKRKRLINSSTHNITPIIPPQKTLMNVEDNPTTGNVFENILDYFKNIPTPFLILRRNTGSPISS